MTKSIHDRFVSVEEAEQWAIKKASEDFGVFIKLVSYNALKLYKIHKEWISTIESTRLSNIATFPGCGKTKIMTYYMAWRIGRNPYETNMILSSSDSQAKSRLGSIKDILAMPMYKRIFPHIYIDNKKPDTQSEFTVASKKWHYNSDHELTYSNYRALVGRLAELKDPTVVALGIGSNSINGRRITGMILIDDVHDNENSRTEDRRNKIYEDVQKVVIPRLTGKKSIVVNICNRFHSNDLAGRLLELVGADGKPVWANLRTPILNQDNEPSVPEMFPMSDIETIMDFCGGFSSPIFQMVYMVNPMAGSSAAFTWDNISNPLPSPLPEFKEIVISVDFAHTQSATSDYTVYTAIAKDNKKPFNMYILDSIRFKLSFISDKVDKLISFYDKICSTYGYVKYIVFEDKDSQAERQYLQSERPDIPITVVKIRSDKASRLGEFEGYVETHKAYFNTEMPLFRIMAGELMDFPKGKHDDICDTISLVFMLPDWISRFGRAGIKFAVIEGSKRGYGI